MQQPEGVPPQDPASPEAMIYLMPLGNLHAASCLLLLLATRVDVMWLRAAMQRLDAQHAGAQDKETKDTPLSKGLDKALLACAPLAMVAYGLGAAVFHTKVRRAAAWPLLLVLPGRPSPLNTCTSTLRNAVKGLSNLLLLDQRRTRKEQKFAS